MAAKSMRSRRASIAPIGVDAEAEDTLASRYTTFFGDDLAANFQYASSESEESEDDATAAKRLRVAADYEEESSADEDDDELDIVDPMNDSFISLSDIDSGDAERGLLNSRIRDWQSDGCKCKHMNCFAALDGEQLETFILSMQQLSKKSKKQFLLGQVAASMRQTSPRAKVREYNHSHYVLGVTECV